MNRTLFLFLLPTVFACGSGPSEPSPACDELQSIGRVQSEVLLHGVHYDPFPEGVITTQEEWRAYRQDLDLPHLRGIDWDTEVVHVTNVWSSLDCEYLDDVAYEPSLVRLDAANLALVAAVTTSSDDCIRQSRPMPVILAVPADEQGDITETCTWSSDSTDLLR